MGKPNFLVQERDGEEQFVYAWTPVLASKKDMRPISDKDAKDIMEQQRLKSERRFDHVVKEPEELDPEKVEDNIVLDSIKPGADKVSDVDGKAKPLVVTQQDILADEQNTIGALHTKNAVEEYVLTKYKLPMLPMDSLGEFKAQAIEMLATLADANSLHK
jgi:hypothetical protein